MSACLFMQDVDKLSEKELHVLKRNLIQKLAMPFDINNRFESDQWAGREHTLGRVYVRLFKLDPRNAA